MRDHYKNMMIELLKDENTVITSGKSFYDIKRPDELYHIIEFTTIMKDNADELEKESRE